MTRVLVAHERVIIGEGGLLTFKVAYYSFAEIEIISTRYKCLPDISINHFQTKQSNSLKLHLKMCLSLGPIKYEKRSINNW